jgi:hypothetical protein
MPSLGAPFTNAFWNRRQRATVIAELEKLFEGTPSPFMFS